MVPNCPSVGPLFCSRIDELDDIITAGGQIIST